MGSHPAHSDNSPYPAVCLAPGNSPVRLRCCSGTIKARRRRVALATNPNSEYARMIIIDGGEEVPIIHLSSKYAKMVIVDGGEEVPIIHQSDEALPNGGFTQGPKMHSHCV